MSIYNYENLQNIISKVNKDDLYITICKNIKKFRLERYNEFKNQNYTWLICAAQNMKNIAIKK